jgi:alpha-D-ribose 1-methylphosphonate 5-triphosphate synthase subunit PhnG
MGEQANAIAARRHWMSVLARASHDALASHLASCAALPAHSLLRGPETGLVMVRGRAGGDGAPFNLGETTVTRCTVRLAGGQIGHAYALGRDPAQAELAALLDAALQDPAHASELLARVVEPLAQAQAAARDAVLAKAAVTRVEFLAMQTTR